MPMRQTLNNVLELFYTTPPDAYAFIYGNELYPTLNGAAYLYSYLSGTLLAVDVDGLPFINATCSGHVFGFHIHEGPTCSGNEKDSFADTGAHFNPHGCLHPEHVGDLPPLFGNQGYAFSIFYTERFHPAEVVGRTLVIHDMADDFHTQPAGDSGMKIGCGVIQENSMT